MAETQTADGDRLGLFEEFWRPWWKWLIAAVYVVLHLGTSGVSGVSEMVGFVLGVVVLVAVATAAVRLTRRFI